MGEFLKVHAVSIALHAGLVAILGLIVPAARDVMARSRPVEIEFIAAKPEPRPPIVPASHTRLAPSPLPAVPHPARVPERAKVAIVDKPRPFQEAADPLAGMRDATPDVGAVPAATTPLVNLEMESFVGAGSATEYVTTSSTAGTLGLRRGAEGGRGGMGAGRGAPGALAGQEGIDLKVSPDWEVTQQPIALNDRDFSPVYPTLARQEGREGEVVVRLYIDDQGRVEEARVEDPAGHGFDESALDYARRLRFRPALAGTRPVAFRIDWTVEFHVRD